MPSPSKLPDPQIVWPEVLAQVLYRFPLGAQRGVLQYTVGPAQTPKLEATCGSVMLSASQTLANKLMNPETTKTSRRMFLEPTEEAKPSVPGNDSFASQNGRKVKGFFLELFAGLGRLTRAVVTVAEHRLQVLKLKQVVTLISEEDQHSLWCWRGSKPDVLQLCTSAPHAQFSLVPDISFATKPEQPKKKERVWSWPFSRPKSFKHVKDIL